MRYLAKAISLWVIFGACGAAINASTTPRNESPKTALLVLDMQEDFLGDQAKMPIKKEQIPAVTAVVNSLIDEFEKDGRQIIYIKSEFPVIALGNKLRHYAAIKGSAGTNIYKKIRISGDVIFSKKTPDAFSNHDFEKYLSANGINRLVITGVFADQCVLDTTLAALDKKYQVTFIRNGVGARSEKDVNKACEKVKQKGGEVVDYQPGIHID